ncbi:hypothetical protein HanXRQr2_Chr12g0547461 [Helianthus annuus]|uniref:Uncharacterized protein n=1 Tax=Helianthus annuus TaxID=4232 RepID=A0A9K3HHL9_HELAN|nr:hypothetical protein HanXRQr2_Chr12g0547461 [Helianthus annuus]KAJ0863182.1 hypothetical protein HanPSC8_Chr12g0526951 [Helianthus annuus]
MRQMFVPEYHTVTMLMAWLPLLQILRLLKHPQQRLRFPVTVQESCWYS